MDGTAGESRSSARRRAEAAPSASEVAGLDALETPLVPRRAAAAPRLGGDLAEARSRSASRSSLWQLVVLGALEAGPTCCPAPPTSSARPGVRPRDGRAVARDRDHAAARRLGLRARGRDRRRASARCVAGSRILRSAVGSLIMGLQTMPSIAWFPLADPAVQAHRGGDHVRRRARRRAVDRERADPRRRPHPAGPAPRRAGRWARKGIDAVPLRHPARRDAQLRRPASSRAGRSPGGA